MHHWHNFHQPFVPMPESNATITDPIEEEEYPFVLMRTVPALRYHEDLHCLSEPGLTQREYEQAVWARTLVMTFHILPRV